MYLNVKKIIIKYTILLFKSNAILRNIMQKIKELISEIKVHYSTTNPCVLCPQGHV